MMKTWYRKMIEGKYILMLLCDAGDCTGHLCENNQDIETRSRAREEIKGADAAECRRTAKSKGWKIYRAKKGEKQWCHCPACSNENFDPLEPSGFLKDRKNW